MRAGDRMTVAVVPLHGDVSLRSGDLLDQTKMGALVSFSAAPIAAAAALVLRVGRWGGGEKPAQSPSFAAPDHCDHIKKTSRK
jgi:hypothetical protein